MLQAASFDELSKITAKGALQDAWTSKISLGQANGCGVGMVVAIKPHAVSGLIRADIIAERDKALKPLTGRSAHGCQLKGGFAGNILMAICSRFRLSLEPASDPGSTEWGCLRVCGVVGFLGVVQSQPQHASTSSGFKTQSFRHMSVVLLHAQYACHLQDPKTSKP